MKRISVFISEPQRALLQELGQRRGRPVAELIREALDCYLLAASRSGPAKGVRELRRAPAKRKGAGQ
jgi:hypothetical protein